MAFEFNNTFSFNESWCRTCEQRTSISSLHSLEEQIESCPSLGDMLLEIAQINIKTESYKDLPKYVCSSCSSKLKSAYIFVVQAQKANRQFIEHLENQNIKQEAVIEIDSADNESDIVDEPDYDDNNISFSTQENASTTKCMENVFVNVNSTTDEFILPVRQDEIAPFNVGSTEVPVKQSQHDNIKHISNLETEEKVSKTNRLKQLLPKIETLEKMVDTQTNTINEMKMNFESLFKHYNRKAVQKISAHTHNTTEFTFKLVESSQELRELDENLNDSKYKDWLINHLSSVCGLDSISDGKSCAHRLIDHLFSREFIASCLLLDGCKEKSMATPNCGIKTYKNVYNIFLIIIQKVDVTFSLQKQDEFFEVILKNEKTRLVTKSTKRKLRTKSPTSKKKYYDR